MLAKKKKHWKSYVKKVFQKFYDKYQKILKKIIFNDARKAFLQQIGQAATNKKLNINFQNALADITFLY